MLAIFSLSRFQHKIKLYAWMLRHKNQQDKSIQSFPERLNTLQSSQSWWLHVLHQFWFYIPDEDCPLQGTNNSLNYCWLIFVTCQAFTPGGCYWQRDKYCPHILSSCLSHTNMGYNWTLQGKHRKMIRIIIVGCDFIFESQFFFKVCVFQDSLSVLPCWCRRCVATATVPLTSISVIQRWAFI